MNWRLWIAIVLVVIAGIAWIVRRFTRHDPLADEADSIEFTASKPEDNQ